eukprot:2888337-Rhodomonas_salina.4
MPLATSPVLLGGCDAMAGTDIGYGGTAAPAAGNSLPTLLRSCYALSGTGVGLAYRATRAPGSVRH